MKDGWIEKIYRNRWVILAFLVVYISSDFSSFLLQALDTVVILSIGVVSSDHSHSRFDIFVKLFFSLFFLQCSNCSHFSLFAFFFNNSFTSPPRQHVYGFPPRHIPQIFTGHFEKFLDAFGARACRRYIRYAPLANVAFGRIGYTGVSAHRMVSAFLIEDSHFII